MDMKYVGMILAVTVGILMVGTILVPIATEVNHTDYDNEGYVYLATDDLGDYAYTVDDNGDLYLNGAAIEYDSSYTSVLNLGVASENFGMTNIYQSNGLWFTAEGYGYATEVDSVTIDSDGSWESVKDSTTSTSTESISGQSFFANNDGDWAVYSTNSSAQTSIRVNEGGTIYLFGNYGQYTVDSTTYGLSYMATYIDGEVTVLYMNGIDSSGNVTDMSDNISLTVAYSDMETEDGVTTYTNLISGIDYGDNTISVRTLAAAPLTYSQESESYSLIMVIPVVVILALLMLVFATIRRDME